MGQRLVAAEREELTRQVRGALRGDLDLLEVLVHGVLGLVAREQELAATEDHREHIVEVVRDAAGEAPDRLDLLHLAHLALALAQDLLRALALRDVAAHAGEPAHQAVLVDQRGTGPLVGGQRAVGAAEAALELELLISETRRQRRAHRAAIVLSEEVDQRRAPELPRPQAGRVLEPPVPQAQAAATVQDVDDLGDGLDEPLELLRGGA